MQFFRVENAKHEGPYNPTDQVQLMDYINSRGIDIWGACFDDYMSTHPNPLHDPMLITAWGNMSDEDRKQYIFGFDSIDSLFAWFRLPIELDYLKEYGFTVSIYEADEIHVGKWQAIAKKKTLKLVEKMQF